MVNFINKIREVADFDDSQDEYAEYSEYSHEERPGRNRVQSSSAQADSNTSFARPESRKILNYSPMSYTEDVAKVGKVFKQGNPVVLNTARLSEEDKGAFIQFCSGLVYGLDGTIEKVAASEDVFLVTPRNVEIMKEDQRSNSPKFAGEFYN